MPERRVEEEQGSLLDVPKQHLPILSGIVGLVFVILFLAATFETAELGEELSGPKSVAYFAHRLSSLLNEYLSGAVLCLGGFEGVYMGIVEILNRQRENKGRQEGKQDGKQEGTRETLQFVLHKLEEENMSDTSIYRELKEKMTKIE